MSWGASPDGTRSSATQVVRNRVREGCERDLSEIKLKKGEPIDRALRRLKKKVEEEVADLVLAQDYLLLQWECLCSETKFLEGPYSLLD